MKKIKKKENKIKLIRYQNEELESYIKDEHTKVVNKIAIPLAKDLAILNKPEIDCESEQIYCGVISSAYNSLAIHCKKELQSDIEESHINSDATESKRSEKELQVHLKDKENDLRLKQRELDNQDNTLVKKDQRYSRIRWFLIFLILTDTLLSSVAMQSMGYSLAVSYLIGLGIGIGIFFISERLPEIINKGRTKWEKRIIAIVSFTLLLSIFYVLGIFRSLNFENAQHIGEGTKPIYFAALNMFFLCIASIVSYFSRPTKKERKILDVWKIKKEEVEKLLNETQTIKDKITHHRKEQVLTELSRKQIVIYAHDLQTLILQLYEESYKTFMSTNVIYRSDGKHPAFFAHPVPKLNEFYSTSKTQS